MNINDDCEDLRRRLQAVLDLCDNSEQGYDWSCFVADVRAAAEGRTGHIK